MRGTAVTQTAAGLPDPSNGRFRLARWARIDPKEPVEVFWENDLSTLELDLPRSRRANRNWRLRSFASADRRPRQVRAFQLSDNCASVSGRSPVDSQASGWSVASNCKAQYNPEAGEACVVHLATGRGPRIRGRAAACPGRGGPSRGLTDLLPILVGAGTHSRPSLSLGSRHFI